MTDIIGLIPAAGKATRLDWPIAKEVLPIKCGLEIIPVMHKTISNMIDSGVNHIVFVTRPEKPEIMKVANDFLNSFRGVDVSYVCQKDLSMQGKSSGLTQAILASYHLIKGKNVVFGMPDTIVEEGYSQLIELLDNGYDLVFGLFETSEPRKYGMVKVGEHDIPVSVIDKPDKTDLTHMWGTLAWSAAFTEVLLLYDKLLFQHILNHAIHVLRTKCVYYTSEYVDLGTKEDVYRLFK